MRISMIFFLVLVSENIYSYKPTAPTSLNPLPCQLWSIPQLPCYSTGPFIRVLGMCSVCSVAHRTRITLFRRSSHVVCVRVCACVCVYVSVSFVWLKIHTLTCLCMRACTFEYVCTCVEHLREQRRRPSCVAPTHFARRSFVSVASLVSHLNDVSV